MKTLLVGGARSGKSTLAARWAGERRLPVCCIVTAIAADAEMQSRIEAHRGARPSDWRLIEEPVHLERALHEASRDGGVVLIDCVTLWISNCLWPNVTVGPSAGRARHLPEEVSEVADAGGLDVAGWQHERAAFLDALAASSAEILLVSNEVGAGIVPDNAAARRFRDEQGWLNQRLAELCDSVYFVAAGLPLRLKPGQITR